MFGDVLHPGGLELTHHLGTVMGLKEADRVLDVACGAQAASAVHLAERMGEARCHVTGVDYGVENIDPLKPGAADPLGGQALT